MRAISSWFLSPFFFRTRLKAARGTAARGVTTKDTRARCQSMMKMPASSATRVNSSSMKSPRLPERDCWILSTSLVRRDIKSPVGMWSK